MCISKQHQTQKNFMKPNISLLLSFINLQWGKKSFVVRVALSYFGQDGSFAYNWPIYFHYYIFFTERWSSSRLSWLFFILCVLPFACLLPSPWLKRNTQHTYEIYIRQEGETLKQVKKRIADFFSSKLLSLLLNFFFHDASKVLCSWNSQNCQNYELQLEIVVHGEKGEWKSWNIRPNMVW